MNNILNQLGIENYIFPERNTFLYWRFWSVVQTKCHHRIYVD